MQKGLRPLKNLKFFTGVENYEESNSIPEDKAFYSNNARFSKKLITSKTGYEALGQILVGGTKMQGVFEYPYFDGVTTTKKLIGIYNKVFYEFNETTQLWVSISTTWPNIKDAYVDGVVAANALFVVSQLDATVAVVSTTYTFNIAQATPITTAPVVGDKYTHGGVTYTVSVVKLSAATSGYGTIVFTRPAAGTQPTASGTLTRTSGAGDATITFASFSSFAQGGGVGKIIAGYDFTFTVAGVTITPDINSVYMAAGISYVVTTTNITAGAGTITMKRLTTFPDPAASGSLAALSTSVYAGDLNLTYTAVSKSAAPVTSFSVIAGSPSGLGIEYYFERLVVISDQVPGLIVMSAPINQPGSDYKLENFNYIITTSGALPFFAKKGGNIVAVRSINNLIYYWTEKRIFQQSSTDITNGVNPTEIARTSGATNQKSTIVVENDVWFINNQNEVRALGSEKNLGDTPRTRSISDIIKKTMDLLEPVQVNPVMSYNQRILKIGLRTRNSPTNNITLIFDENTQGFGIDYGQAINVACVWKNFRIYGEDATGQAYKDEYGYGANGAAFPFQVDLPMLDDGRPDTFKRARYIYVKGQQSYYQDLTIRLYIGTYLNYKDYLIPSPFTRGVAISSVNNAVWGNTTFGGAPWGGTPTDASNGDITMYIFEKLISIQQKSNLFAIGLLATINGSKVQVEQLLLKVVDENENFKRSDY